MSFRQPDIQAPNALAQFAQIQQIQGGRQAQELAQYQLGAAQRAEATQNALADAYAQSIDPDTGAINYNKLTGLLAKGGGALQIPGIEKTRRELETAEIAKRKALQDIETGAITQKNIQSQISERDFGLQKKKLDFSWNAVGSAPDPQAAIAELTKGAKDGVFDMRSATAEIQKLQRMTTPEEYRAYRAEKISNILEAKDKLGFMLPNIARQDIGGQIVNIQNNPMLPGYGQPVAGGAITKTPTISEITAQRQLGVSQGQLSLAQQKFAFERANPTMSIQEDPTGLLAVNTRTGVATPVVYGPNGIQAAPTAPSASMMRPPEAQLPGPRISAIPGMNSVLDRNAAPAAMPMPAVEGARIAGTPVRGGKEAPAKFNDTDMQLAGLTGSLKEFQDEVGKKLITGARFLPSGADTARMQAKYTALLMGVKDLYTLGALTGPDMSIIESQLTNPASWAGKMTTQKGFEEQTKVIEDMLKRTAANLENTYNRQPRATKKALESLGSGIPGASANDPLGLGIKGR
jgi:hypothetical protein